MYTIYINNKKVRDFDKGYDLAKIIKHYLFAYQNSELRVLVTNSIDE